MRFSKVVLLGGGLVVGSLTTALAQGGNPFDPNASAPVAPPTMETAPAPIQPPPRPATTLPKVAPPPAPAPIAAPAVAPPPQPVASAPPAPVAPPPAPETTTPPAAPPAVTATPSEPAAPLPKSVQSGKPGFWDRLGKWFANDETPKPVKPTEPSLAAKPLEPTPAPRLQPVEPPPPEALSGKSERPFDPKSWQPVGPQVVDKPIEPPKVIEVAKPIDQPKVIEPSKPVEIATPAPTPEPVAPALAEPPSAPAPEKPNLLSRIGKWFGGDGPAKPAKPAEPNLAAKPLDPTPAPRLQPVEPPPPEALSGKSERPFDPKSWQPVGPQVVDKPTEPPKPVEIAKPVEPPKVIEPPKPVEVATPALAPEPAPSTAAAPEPPAAPAPEKPNLLSRIGKWLGGDETPKPIDAPKPVEAVKPAEPSLAAKPLEPTPAPRLQPVEPPPPEALSGKSERPFDPQSWQPVGPQVVDKPIEPPKVIEIAKPEPVATPEPAKIVEAPKPVEAPKLVEPAKPVKTIKPAPTPESATAALAEPPATPAPEKPSTLSRIGKWLSGDDGAPSAPHVQAQAETAPRALNPFDPAASAPAAPSTAAAPVAPPPPEPPVAIAAPPKEPEAPGFLSRFFKRLSGNDAIEKAKDEPRTLAVGPGEVPPASTNALAARTLADEPPPKPTPSIPPSPQLLAAQVGLGNNLKLGQGFNPQQADQHCFTKGRNPARFCTLPLTWPTEMTPLFRTSTILYTGSKAVARFDDDKLTRLHVLFPNTAFDTVAGYLERLYGPPTDRMERRVRQLQGKNEANPLLMWRKPGPNNKNEIIEIRRYDDSRRDFPDVDNGAMRVYYEDSADIFTQVSALDFLSRK